MRLLRPGEEGLAVSAPPEPFPDDAQVRACLLRADAEVFGELLGRDTPRVECEVGKELDVVRPAVRRRRRITQRPDSDRPEQGDLRRDRYRGVPAGDVLVQVR